MDGSQRQNRETVAEAAARLPWLGPSAGALERLATETVPVEELAFDPALILLALRYSRPSPSPDRFTFRSLRESVVAEAAARLLESPVRFWLDPSNEFQSRWLALAQSLSVAARGYAETRGTCPPDAAAAIGLLAPLGELAIASVSPVGPFDCADSVARRLVHRWRLPEWVAGTLATQKLPLADAVRLGADPELARMLREVRPAAPRSIRMSSAESPFANRLLGPLLRSVAQTRRATSDYRLRVAESEVDRLYRLLGEVREDFEVALRDAKLAGLAELAAGAGHEINNPLAIISGHIRRLRKNENEPERQKAFDAVLRQTERISDLVRELMVFARPSTPSRGTVDIGMIVGDMIEELESEATSREIALVPILPDSAIRIDCDSNQLRKILKNLIRNALEASDEGGQVRIVVASDATGVQIAVEDDGPGPSDEAVPHLFDPFYSGRPAGRGRGLGLAAAWRLASINGGDLQYHREPNGPTRFLVEFPNPQPAIPPLRIPA
jgi:two-component system NtrC family sensor kinase